MLHNRLIQSLTFEVGDFLFYLPSKAVDAHRNGEQHFQKHYEKRQIASRKQRVNSCQNEDSQDEVEQERTKHEEAPVEPVRAPCTDWYNRIALSFIHAAPGTDFFVVFSEDINKDGVVLLR